MSVPYQLYIFLITSFVWLVHQLLPPFLFQIFWAGFSGYAYSSWYLNGDAPIRALMGDSIIVALLVTVVDFFAIHLLPPLPNEAQQQLLIGQGNPGLEVVRRQPITPLISTQTPPKSPLLFFSDEKEDVVPRISPVKETKAPSGSEPNGPTKTFRVPEPDFDDESDDTIFEAVDSRSSLLSSSNAPITPFSPPIVGPTEITDSSAQPRTSSSRTDFPFTTRADETSTRDPGTSMNILEGRINELEAGKSRLETIENSATINISAAQENANRLSLELARVTDALESETRRNVDARSNLYQQLTEAESKALQTDSRDQEVAQLRIENQNLEGKLQRAVEAARVETLRLTTEVHTEPRTQTEQHTGEASLSSDQIRDFDDRFSKVQRELNSANGKVTIFELKAKFKADQLNETTNAFEEAKVTASKEKAGLTEQLNAARDEVESLRAQLEQEKSRDSKIIDITEHTCDHSACERKHQKLNEAIKALEKVKITAFKEKAGLTEQLNAARDEIESLRAQLEQEKSRDSKIIDITEHTCDHSACERKHQKLNEAVKTLEKVKITAFKEKAGLAEQLNAIRDEVEFFRAQLEQKQSRNSKMIDITEHTCDHSACERKYQKLNETAKALENGKAGLTEQLNVIRDEDKSLRAQLEQEKSRDSEMIDITEHTCDHSTCEGNYQKLNEVLGRVTDEKTALGLRYNNLNYEQVKLLRQNSVLQSGQAESDKARLGAEIRRLTDVKNTTAEAVVVGRKRIDMLEAELRKASSENSVLKSQMDGLSTSLRTTAAMRGNVASQSGQGSGQGRRKREDDDEDGPEEGAEDGGHVKKVERVELMAKYPTGSLSQAPKPETRPPLPRSNTLVGKSSEQIAREVSYLFGTQDVPLQPGKLAAALRSWKRFLIGADLDRVYQASLLIVANFKSLTPPHFENDGLELFAIEVKGLAEFCAGLSGLFSQEQQSQWKHIVRCAELIVERGIELGVDPRKCKYKAFYACGRPYWYQ